MRDSGHQAVGHVLLVSVVSGGALILAQLADVATRGLEDVLRALG